jgi:hypothetical protein
MSPALFAIPIGLLLIGTAVLKLLDLASGGTSSSAWFDPLIILFEFSLGTGLVFVRRRGGLWLIAVATFLTFAIYNVDSIRIGQASCGCFGSVPLSPWTALAMDVAVLVLLAVWGVLYRDTLSIREGIPDVVAFSGGMALTALIWLVVVHVGFGSTAAMWSALRGDHMFLETPVVDFGPVPGGQAAEHHLVIRNSSVADIRVIGGTSNCACTLIPDLPTTVAPGESRRLLVRVGVPRTSGAFQFHAVLWTDSQTNEAIPVLLRGRSVGP